MLLGRHRAMRKEIDRNYLVAIIAVEAISGDGIALSPLVTLYGLVPTS